MTSTSARNRQSAGQPTGGQFATEAKSADTGVDLGASPDDTMSPQLSASTVLVLVDDALDRHNIKMTRETHQQYGSGLLATMNVLDDHFRSKGSRTTGDERLDTLLFDTVCMDTARRSSHDPDSRLLGSSLSENDRLSVLADLRTAKAQPVAEVTDHREDYVFYANRDWDRACRARARTELDQPGRGQWKVRIGQAQGRNLASVRTAFGTYKGEVDDDATADTIAEDPEVGDWSERNDVTFTAAY